MKTDFRVDYHISKVTPVKDTLKAYFTNVISCFGATL